MEIIALNVGIQCRGSKWNVGFGPETELDLSLEIISNQCRRNKNVIISIIYCNYLHNFH